ncbi:MAG: D-alanyl-D-alanine carboxypeptidase family protein [Lachnospiraceae bacterium]
MKYIIRTAGCLLLSLMLAAAAVPRAVRATAPQDGAQSQDSVQGTEAKDPYQQQLEDTYKQEVQTNKLKEWPQGPGIYGDAGIVMDAETGAVLYGKNIDQQEYPASITKLLTALLAFEYCDMTEDVVITAESLTCLGDGYASIGLKEGNVISMEQALYAMLLASSNEVAYALGETVAKTQGEDYQWFIDEMNRKVEELGGTNSHFVNTNGVHEEDHYTCARDMALIAKELFDYPEFFTICQTTSYTIPASATTEEHIFQQKHEMLVPGYSDYYEYAVGGKTGYTTEANNTLVTMADNGDMKLVCVTLKVFPGHVYSDTKALLDYGFSNFQHMAIDVEGSQGIEKILDTASVTIPSGFELSSLKSDLEQVTGGNSTAILSYTYEDNPVGRLQVQVDKGASFEEAGAQEEEEASDSGVGKVLLVGAVVIVLILGILLLFTAWCRRQRRRRRRGRRRRRRR